MAALHFVGIPPELLAQLMPAQLPQLAVPSEGKATGIFCDYASRIASICSRDIVFSSMPALFGAVLCVRARPMTHCCKAVLLSLHAAAGRKLRVHTMAWDAHGERLAVAVRGVDSDEVGVMLYSTAIQPVLTARYIGRIACGPSRQHTERQSPTDCGDSNDRVALAFQPGFEGGGLLGMRCDDTVRAVPLYIEPTSCRTRP